jgi:hypothetical protein
VVDLRVCDFVRARLNLWISSGRVAIWRGGNCVDNGCAAAMVESAARSSLRLRSQGGHFVGMDMEHKFGVENLEVDVLLSNWRWLCPNPVTLVARSAFGDLFLRDDAGSVFWLDVAVGSLTKISDSESEFREMAKTDENRQKWFAEADVQAAGQRGLKPDQKQCIAFKTPLVLAKPGVPNPAYIADLYEYVSLLGDVNRQIADLPDGSKVPLEIEPSE